MNESKFMKVYVMSVAFLSLYTAWFVALKVPGFIDWSWWWVGSPWVAVLAWETGVFFAALYYICKRRR